MTTSFSSTTMGWRNPNSAMPRTRLSAADLVGVKIQAVDQGRSSCEKERVNSPAGENALSPREELSKSRQVPAISPAAIATIAIVRLVVRAQFRFHCTGRRGGA